MEPRFVTAVDPHTALAIAAAVRTLTTLEDWLRGREAHRPIVDVVIQDEFTHDVIVEWSPDLHLVLDST